MAAAVPFLLGAGTAAAVGASVAVAVAVGVGTVAVMDYMMDAAMPDAYSPTAQEDTMSSRNITGKNSTAPREIVYGQARKGGAVVWQHTHGTDQNPDSDEFYNMVIAWHHGEAEEIKTIYFGDEVAWQDGYYKGRFASNGSSSLTGEKIRIWNKLGLYNQSAVTDIGTASTWTTNHRMRFITYSRLKFEYDVDQYPNGAPKVTAEIKGRKVYDPRDSSHSLTAPSGWDYSDNPVLCLLDYLKEAPYKDWGAELSADLFDMTQIASAASYCDGTTGSSDNARKTYSCNGVISTRATVKENIQNLLSCMHGKLLFINGKFQIRPYRYISSSDLVLNEDMIIGDFIVSNSNPRRVAFNEVRGEYVSKEAGYVKTEYPPQRSSAYQTDDADNLRKNLNLPFTTDKLQAQRLATLALNKSRMQKTIKTTINARGIDFAIGDNIKVTNTVLGITDNIYEITSLRLQSNESGVKISLEARENVSSIYNQLLSTEELYTTGTSVNIPVRSVAPHVQAATVNVGAVPVKLGQGFTTGIAISWEHPPALRLNYYRVAIGQASGVPTHRFKKYTTTNNFITIPNETGLDDLKISIYAYGINQSRSVETLKTFDSGTQFNLAGDLSYVIYGDASIAPTDAEFAEYYGRPPQDGDEITVIELDGNGLPTDSKTYIFTSPITLYASPDNENIYTRALDVAGGSAQQIFSLRVFDADTGGADVTWTTSVSNFETNATLNQQTFFELDLGNIVGSSGFQCAGQIARSTFSSLNPVNDLSLPVAEQYPVDVAYVKYDVSVTASWVFGGSAIQRTRSLSIYLQVTGFLS
jgi:hypothetical protein